VKPDQQILNLLSAPDRQAVITSDRNYNNQVSQANGDTSEIDGYNQAWDKFAISFKAEALATRDC